MTWKEFRIEREGRRGWEIALPCFYDDERPEDAARMNRFYETAAERMVSAAGLDTSADARRARYRCVPRIAVLTEEDARDRKKQTGAGPSPGTRRGIFARKPKNGGSAGEAERAGDIRVTLALELSVSGRKTRRRTLEHLWRDGVLLSSRVLL